MKGPTLRKRIARAKEAGRLVDVYSDASFRHGVGGWAAVIIRAECGRMAEASGRLKECERSELAELQSCANALHAGHKAGLIRPGELAVIRCDNSNTVQRIRAAHVPGTARDQATAACLRWIIAFAEAGGFLVTAQHVKGHQPEDSDDPHAQHNRRCDVLAKRETGARGGRAPVTIEEKRRHAARQSARSKAQNAARALVRAAELAGRR